MTLHVVVIKANTGEVSIPGIARAGVPSMGQSGFTVEGRVRRAIPSCQVVDSARKRHEKLPDGSLNPTTQPKIPANGEEQIGGGGYYLTQGRGSLSLSFSARALTHS